MLIRPMTEEERQTEKEKIIKAFDEFVTQAFGIRYLSDKWTYALWLDIFTGGWEAKRKNLTTD